jgi:CBS domain-containing protein
VAHAVSLDRVTSLTASTIMNATLLTVAPGDPLSLALTLMDKHEVHHLLVVERDRMAAS